MARFDVYPQAGGVGYLLDCQADVLDRLNTRFVVPLLPPGEGPLPIQRLNPALMVGDREVIMYTQFAAAVPARELNGAVASLGDEHRTIMNALDVLLTGY
jgi:toxin CcdB